MSTRKFTTYEDPSLNQHKIGCWVRSYVDRALLNAGIATYSQTRRNILNLVHNVEGTFAWTNDEDIQVWRRLFTVPISVLRKGGSQKLNIWTLGSCGSGADADAVKIRFEIFGSGEPEIGEAEHKNTSLGWSETVITLADIESYQNDQMSVSIKALGTGQSFELYAISAYQEGGACTDYTDLSSANSKVGEDDFSDCVFARKLLRDNVVAVRDNRTVKSNVFNHWFQPSYKTGSAYAADNGQLGRYKFVKRAGVETVEVHCLANRGAVGGDWTLRVEMNGTSDETNTVNSTSLGWYTATFTLTGSDITDELELELLLDGKETGGGSSNTQNLPLVCVVEDHGGASVTHSVPDVLDCQPVTGKASPILSSTWNQLRDTMDHLWQVGGYGIAMQDFRPVGTNGGDYLTNDTTSFSKSDYLDNGSCMIARAICYPSKNSKRLLIVLNYSTTSGSSYAKHLHIQISDDESTFTTWDDVHPEFENDTNGAYQFTDDVSEELRAFSCELDIPSGEQEVHDPAGTPIQVFVCAKTDNTGEYVIPHSVSVFELDLLEDEFP